MVYMETKSLVVSKLQDVSLSQGQGHGISASQGQHGVFKDNVEAPGIRHSVAEPYGGRKLPLEENIIPSAVARVTTNLAMHRPRSFSDASLSSGHRRGILKKINTGRLNPEHKTSMRVFVRRESKTIVGFSDIPGQRTMDDVATTGKTNDNTDVDVFPPSLDKSSKQSEGYASYENLLVDKQCDVHAQTTVDDRLLMAPNGPPKPKLPKDYRQSLNEQLKVFNQHQGRRIDYKTADEIAENMIAKKVGEPKQTEHGSVIETDEKGDKDQGQLAVNKQLRRGRSSVSTNNLVYKHFDPKFRLELLRKELEKVRRMKHVRKNSETMKQKFEEILRPKSTSDLHVRFADELEALAFITTPGSNSNDLGVIPDKPPLKQTSSIDIYTEPVNDGQNDRQTRSERLTSEGVANEKQTVPPSGYRGTDRRAPSERIGKGLEPAPQIGYRQWSEQVVNDSKTMPQSGYRLNERQRHVIHDTRAVPPSGATVVDCSDAVVRQRAMTMAAESSGQVSREPRRLSLARGPSQARSRSATTLERNKYDQSKAEWRPLGSTQGSQLSKSASNLRRKQDTIRKFNFSSVEQKREHIREKFERERRNRPISMSPDEDSINLERELAIASEKLMAQRLMAQRAESAKSNSDARGARMRGAEIRSNASAAALSDNRSDEEKYAALSRFKILHIKSSSLDSQNSQNSERNSSNAEAARKKLALTAHGNVVRQTAYVKPRVNTNTAVSLAGTGSGEDSITNKGSSEQGVNSNRNAQSKTKDNFVNTYRNAQGNATKEQQSIQISHSAPCKINEQNAASDRRDADFTVSDRHKLTKGANTGIPSNVPNVPTSNVSEIHQQRKAAAQSGSDARQRHGSITTSSSSSNVPTKAFHQSFVMKRKPENVRTKYEQQSVIKQQKPTESTKHEQQNVNKQQKPTESLQSNQSKPVSKVNEAGNSGQLGGKLFIKQCRVGSDVAFGLVAVQDTTIVQDAASQNKPNGNGYLDGQGLVTIRMIPDDQGRFGFNVKGGADQGMPIIVSRVAPNTPADNAIPRLNEGDQVLFINGRDVSQHTHEQVVLFIRQSRETRTKELKLIVRPNAYTTDDASDDHEGYCFELESFQISTGGGVNALDNSLKLLEESLESNAAIAQFEQLYRKKPGMTMNIARLDANVPKNRYRDISPYDQTRVMIKNGPNGDYINANYVNMEIPVSGILNRYIAAQGPLPTTCVDFWQMIWEQQSTLVVMLTTEEERGRIKCHQYWPNLYETADHGHLQITCVKEEKTASFAFREFNLTNVESHEERHISHMQYIAWPDHGVPDDPADFLDFVIKVRQKRVGFVEPSIVHCSAGIGRTGVLITMETAMCLIEANQPVHPLSIVRQMRDQRAMLIQTPNQYKFVCEAIIRCFNEGIVKPLPEYQQR